MNASVVAAVDIFSGAKTLQWSTRLVHFTKSAKMRRDWNPSFRPSVNPDLVIYVRVLSAPQTIVVAPAAHGGNNQSDQGATKSCPMVAAISSLWQLTTERPIDYDCIT